MPDRADLSKISQLDYAAQTADKALEALANGRLISVVLSSPTAGLVTLDVADVTFPNPLLDALCNELRRRRDNATAELRQLGITEAAPPSRPTRTQTRTPPQRRRRARANA